MKKLLYLIALIPFLLFGQNRVATLSDLTKYGSYVTVGDFIADTPTNGVPFADGINQLRYTSISKSFPGIRENAIIWIDGKKIGKLCEIRFLNGTELTPWHISNATLKPIPGTRVDGVYTKNSYGGFLYLVQGLKNMGMLGSSQGYTGLDGLQDGDFLQGRFGFGGTSTGIYQGYHVYSLSVLPGGSINLEGLEGEHGFSVLRAQGGNYDGSATLTLTNFFFHNSSSETIYLGATHGPPFCRLKDLTIYNGIIACSGSEGIQAQHLIGKAHIYNVTLFASDAGRLNEFQPFQDTGAQLSADAGNNLVENIVIDGSGSHTINFFGSDLASTEKKTTVRNVLINNPSGEAIYFHPSVKWGMKWYLDNISIRKPNHEYYVGTKFPVTNWLISNNNGTDSIFVNNIKFEGTTTLFQNISNKFKVGEIIKGEIPDVEYVNSGFYEPTNRIKYYERYYGKYLTGIDFKPVDYKAGDILQDREPGFYPVWCKVTSDFTANEVRPKNRPDCIILSWDAAGVRNDQPNWNSAAAQKHYPPFDCRVQHDNYYAKQGIGLVEPAPPLEQELQLAKELIAILTADKQALLNQSVIDKASITKLNSEIELLKNEVTLLKAKIEGLYSDMNLTLEKYK